MYLQKRYIENIVVLDLLFTLMALKMDELVKECEVLDFVIYELVLF